MGKIQNGGIVRITITTKPQAGEYDLFGDMPDTGMGAINAIDDNGNPVDMPQELHDMLLKWAGYDAQGKMKKIELLGLDTEVEFNESEVFEHETSTGDKYEAAITTDGRLIGWDDGANSWVQLARRAE